MRLLFDELVFDQEIIGTTPVYSDPFFNPLLGLADQMAVAMTCELVGGDAAWVRVDLEHSNDNQHWAPRTGLVPPTPLSTSTVTTVVGVDSGAAPLGAYARVRVALGGKDPRAMVRLGAAPSCTSSAARLLWEADFSGCPPGALTQLPGGLALTRASSATVQTSATTVVVDGIAADVARVGDDGTHAGLVLEESRTNLIPYARALDGASWSTGSNVTTTADAATGPDGTAGIADRSQVAKDGYSNFDTQSSATAGTYTLSQWYQRGSANSTHQLALRTDSGSTNAATGGTAPAYWQRTAVQATHTSGTVWSIPADGRDWSGSGGVSGAARDVVSDLVQLELGGFATEVVVTNGNATTRAGERLYYPTAAGLVNGGRLGLEFKLQPKGAPTAYSAVMRLWTIDASNYAQIDEVDTKLKVVIGGIAVSFATALSWAAGDTLELWVAAGDGATATVASYRVNGGAVTSLGTQSALGALTPTGAIDLLCNGTSNQFSAWVQRIRAYAHDSAPEWVA